MILGFSTKFPKGKGTLSGKKTFFINKIMKSIWLNFPKETNEFSDEKISVFNSEKLTPKIHTIRVDKNSRWKVGNDIHFSINVRTKKMFRFAPIIKVKSIQKIEIVHRGIVGERKANIYIDNVIIGIDEMEQLAINDGFDSVENFFEWFSNDFTGKIIHWTDLKY